MGTGPGLHSALLKPCMSDSCSLSHTIPHTLLGEERALLSMVWLLPLWRLTLGVSVIGLREPIKHPSGVSVRVFPEKTGMWISNLEWGDLP
jgi:hypothetical protein